MRVPNFVIHSPVNGQLGCFHLSAVVNSAAISVHVGVLVEFCFQLFEGVFSGGELLNCIVIAGFPGGAVIKNLPANAGDSGSILGSGRSPGNGNGNLIQCSCLENCLDRGAQWATVHGVAKSQTGPSN